MKVAILGAGFCGLAAAWHLLQQNSSVDIDIFDPNGIGGGASGIAAGLLHPYGGAHAKLNWMGYEGYAATKELLQIASKFLGRPVSKDQGVLRLALTDAQKIDFTRSASLYDDIEWLSVEQCQALVPGVAHAPGILIKSGVCIYSRLYLEGLWLACASAGAKFHKKKISSLEKLSQYDTVIIAMGAAAVGMPETEHLSLKLVKGQVLELEWPSPLAPLPLALNSQAYIIMNEDNTTCLAGATYERDTFNDKPDIDIAQGDILPKAINLYPPLKTASVKACYAGLRVSTPNHRPIIAHLKDNSWIITGMGSKGLLYHAWAAKKLVALLNE